MPKTVKASAKRSALALQSVASNRPRRRQNRLANPLGQRSQSSSARGSASDQAKDWVTALGWGSALVKVRGLATALRSARVLESVRVTGWVMATGSAMLRGKGWALAKDLVTEKE